VLHSDGFSVIAWLTSNLVYLNRSAPATMTSRETLLPLVRFPHSRWNEVREDALTACGYTVLIKSPQAGVDIFVKQKRKSLFVHFQVIRNTGR